MFGSLGASDVFTIVVIVLAVFESIRWVISRSTVKEPAIPVPRPTLDAGTIRTVSDLVAQDKRIEAIKRLRDATGLGLREAKEWVDASTERFSAR